MRVCLLLCVLLAASLVTAAPARSNLQLGAANNDADQQPFVEEVVVESVLQVRSATPGRQARTEAHTSLQDGATVAKTQ